MGLKIYIYIIIFTLLASAIGGAVWYYKWSQAEISVLRENVVKMEIALQTEKEAVKSMKTDIKKVGKQVIYVNTEFEKSRTENNNLRKKLSKHDIAYLASKKPGLVEKIINNAAVDAERCFEILTGAELTDSEIAATKKSQANSECPGLANPNYKARR